MAVMRQNDGIWTVDNARGEPGCLPPSRSVTDMAPAQPWEPKKTVPHYYAPFTTRTPWLITLLVAVLGCVAALEIAFNSGVDTEQRSETARLARRQDTTPSPDFTIFTSTPATTRTTSIVPTTPDVVESPSLSHADPTSFVTPTSTPTTTSTGGADESASADPSDFISNDRSNIITTTTTGDRVTAASQDQTAFITDVTVAPSPVVSSFVTDDTQTTEEVQLLTVLTVSAETTIEKTLTSDGSTVTVSSVVSNVSPSLVTLAVSPTVVTTVVSGTTAVISTSATVTASSTSSASNNPAPTGVKASQVQITESFEDRDYFLASYLAIVLAVTLKLTWQLVFSGLKMLEPFYQLSKPGGAAASESLLADYLSAAYGWNHLRHIFSGHSVMLFSSLVYVAMACLSPIASESMTITATQLCQTAAGGTQPCAPVWVLNIAAGRVLEGVLILTAILIMLVIIFNFRRRSGIFSNPSSIATMASLLSHDDLLSDLRQIDASAPDASIVAALSGNRYMLMSYNDAAGIPRYGITKTTSSAASNPYSLGPTNNFDAMSQAKYAALSNPSNMALQEHPITEQKPFSVSWRTARDVLFLLVILALFGIVLAYYVVGDRSAFNNFFNSGTFGPKFTLTAVAALIDFLWKTLEREVRILVPYQRLGARQAGPEKSVLVDVAGVPISSMWGALRRGEILHAVVAFTAILSDVLIIAVGGVPFGTGSFWEAYLYSSYLSLGILGWMALVMSAVFWWRAQVRRLRMPREPDTILSVWLMLADEGNRVLKEYGGWETTRGAERDRAATGRGSRYWGGWAKGEDGIERWCVGMEGGESSLMGYEHRSRY